MKKYFIGLATLALLAVACTQETTEVIPEIEIGKRHITVLTETPSTRTVLDDQHNALLWTAGDNFRLMTNTTTEGHDAQTLTYTAGGKFEVEVGEDATEAYAYFFAGDYTDPNHSTPTAYTSYIEYNQTQTKAGVLNGKMLPMAAKGTIENNTVSLKFHQMAGVLALNIYSTEKVEGEVINSVKVTPTANTNFCGAMSGTNLTTDDIVYSTGSSNKYPTITVQLDEAYDYASSKPENKKMFGSQIYVVLAKQSYSAVKFEIETNKSKYEITSSGAALDLVENDFYPVNINLAKAKKEIRPTVFNVGTEIASVFPSVKNGIKFSYEQGTGTSVPVYYSPFRWYVNSTVTISAGNTALKEIEFTFASSYARELTPSTGSFTIEGTTGTWVPAGSETSVTFTNGTSGQARFSSISVITDAEGTESVVTSTPTLSIDDLQVAAGSVATLNTTTNYLEGTKSLVSYSSSNSSVATVNATSGVVSGVAGGTATITATTEAVSTDWYIINSASASCSVTVTDAVIYDDITVNDWDYTFESNPWGATSGDANLVDGQTTINWALTASYAQYTSGYLAFNTASNKNTATIKTNNVITNVNSVVVYAKTNSGKKVTLTVKAGNTTLGSYTLSSVTTLTAYTFTAASSISGKVSIEFTDPDGGYQIKEIRINPVAYSITCATPQHGTISAQATGYSNERITLSANADSGYELDEWVVTNLSTNQPIIVTENVFIMPNSNVSVSATFKTAGAIVPVDGVCFDLTSYGSLPQGWTCSNVSTGSYFRVDAGGSMISPAYNITGCTSATVSIKVAKYGTGTNPAAVLYVSYDGGNTWSESKTLTAPASSSYLSAQTLTLGKGFTNNVVIRLENPQGNASLRVQEFSFKAQ